MLVSVYNNTNRILIKKSKSHKLWKKGREQAKCCVFAFILRSLGIKIAITFFSKYHLLHS